MNGGMTGIKYRKAREGRLPVLLWTNVPPEIIF